MKRTGKLIIAGLALILLISSVIIYFLFPPPGPASTDNLVFSMPEQVDDSADEIEVRLGNRTLKLPRRKLIAAVEPEKNTVCAGEGLLVRAEAREKNVMFKIGSAPGNPVITRFAKPGPRKLTVLAVIPGRAFDTVSRTIQVLSAATRECAAKNRFKIHTRISGSEPHRVRFRLVGKSGKHPKRVQWDFGDGTRRVDGVSVSHGYGLRKQGGPASSFIVSARPEGRRESVRASVLLANVNWLDKTRGKPTFPVDYGRFPRKAGKDFIADLRLKNIEKTALRLKDARLRIEACRDDVPHRERVLDAGEFLKVTELAPGAVIARSLRLERSMLGPDACRVELLIRGDTNPPRSGELVNEGPHRGDIKYGETHARIALVLRNPFASLKQRKK